MKLEATVRRIMGNAKHSIGTIENGEVVPVEEMPAATRLLIDPEGDAYLLIRFDALGEFAGDTWHRTIAEAKKQAKFEYDVEESDWKEVAEEA